MAQNRDLQLVKTKRKTKLEKYLESCQDPLVPPSKMSGKGASPRGISRGSYQRKLLAFFAPHIIPDLLNGIRRGIAANDSQALKLAAEIYQFTAKKGPAVTVNVEQNNDNRTANLSGKVEPGELMTFEEMARVATDSARKRLMPGAAAVVEAHPFIATPED